MAKQARYGASEPPMQIYQDAFFDDSTTPMISRAPMAPASKQHRRPLQSANSNVVLNPPNASFVNQSPFKSNPRISDAPLTPLKQAQGSKLNTVYMMPPNRLPHSTDSPEKKQPMMSRFKTVAQKPQQQPLQQQHPEINIQFMGKENMHTPIYPAPGPQQFNIPLENYYQKPSGKRVLLEAAPIKELRPAKKPRLEEPLPSHDAFPPILDDGTKPNHSYATLIGMAILRSPQRRLTLAQIYKWISDTYKFYNPNDAGWQNSIRHNLSLNKSFNKQERPKDDPGKGHYWTILPGTEHLFMKEKPSRKSAPSAENLPVMSTRLEPSQPHMHHHLMQESILPPQLPMSQSSLPAMPPSSRMAPVLMPQPEISSDATIPASDLAALDELTDRANENEFLNDPDLYSPLPAAMHSSPPIPKHLESRHGDTPPPQRLSNGSSATKSISRSHNKRAFTSINDDSGYISSLESSVMRPSQHTQLLTSEADRPRVKRARGRAEEEIARLRGSSYDSPSKGRSYGYPASSSPLRQSSHNGSGQMLPPLTPAMKLKAPPKPPPSVSPSTNLRLHRESVQSMVDSPYRRAAASLLPDSDTPLQFTPGLNLDEVFFNMDRKPEDDNADFGIYQDNMFESIFTLSPGLLPTNNGSPVKRSAKRKDRSLSTGALNDVTHSSHNTNSASFLKVPGYSNNMMLETPSKAFDGLVSSPSKLFMQSPSKLFMQSPSKMTMPLMNDENAPFSLDDLCGDFPDESEFHIDMLSGWEKIGSSNVQTTRATKPSKPGFGRCYSTAF